MAVYIGTAGWAVRKPSPAEIASQGTHLQRYATQFNAVEINSSFYRPHRRATYERWSASTPPGFMFAVKVPKRITHEKRLRDCEAELERFLTEACGLGEKLGPLLVQLPPSLAWKEELGNAFFATLRGLHVKGPIVCEPRHESWFLDDATRQFIDFEIGRVAADPSIVPAAAVPGGCTATCYFRWHGSPRTYYSSYDEKTIRSLANSVAQLETESHSVWCMFDNTAENAAWANAQTLSQCLPEARIALQPAPYR